MKKSKNYDHRSKARRAFLKASLVGSAAYLTFGNPELSLAANFALSAYGEDRKGALTESPEVEIVMTALEENIQLLPGAKTKVWRFVGQIIRGPADCLTSSKSYLGPLLKFRVGQSVRIRFDNQLPERSIIHWHGLHLPERFDGHPSYAVGSGASYTYEFTVDQRPGTYWYHPHPHGRTGYQVYHGLAGMLIVEDKKDNTLELPSGENDLAFCIQDRRIDDQNQLLYLNNGGHDRMMGMMGDRLFINGEHDQSQTVSSCAKRIRILNGSNARIYNLAWDDHQDLNIIGNDGGLLQSLEKRKSVLLGPGERVELIKDFSNLSLGHRTKLMSVPLTQGNDREAFPVLSFIVDKQIYKPFELPNKLSSIEPLRLNDAVNSENPKVFHFRMDRGKGWTIDGLTYEMGKSNKKETVSLNTLEIWEIENSSTGMMSMPHPVHIHGSQFQILERIGARFENYLDLGWKDTVLIMPGERVRILKRFDDFKGQYLYHCHNLEHEDLGMMREFQVV